MVVVECPHCDEDIELPDTAAGSFECPHCDEEFEWGVESDLEHEDTVQSRDFWIGLSAPFLSMCFGLLLTTIIFGDSWDGLLWGFLSLLLWPVLGLGIAIWGYVNHRGLLWIGASVSLAISTPLVLLLVFAWL